MFGTNISQMKTEVIAVSSGKGGVGKTTLCVNLGIAMSRQGKNVCLFDADTNLANINIMLRETPMYTLQHVLDGEHSISEIIVRSNGISLVPGASGVTDFNELDNIAQTRLLKALSALERQYDVILVDTSAGIHDNVLDFIQAAHQTIVVVTPEPTSLTDSFSLLRMLRKRKYRKRINVVVNSADSELGARKVFKRFSGAVAKYIGYQPAYLGYVGKDPIVSSAICSQVPVRVYRPESIASLCFDRLAKSLLSLIKQHAEDQSLSDNWYKQISLDPQKALEQSVSSPVPGSSAPRARKIAKPLQPDKAQQLKYQHDDRARKKQLLEEHAVALIDYIENTDFTKHEIALTLERFHQGFFKRFKDYPADIVSQINVLLQINALPQAQINQLLSELMLFYRDNRLRIDRDSNAEFLNQQINDYVDEYGQYPFDTTQALMQSIGMGQVTNEAIVELDNILHLVGKSAISLELKSRQSVYATDIKQDLNDVADSIIETVDKNNVVEKVKKREHYVNQALKDSISFASKVAE